MPRPAPALRPPDLESRVRALDPWFHDIDLGGGVRTKVARCADEPLDHPRSTWDLVRPLLGGSGANVENRNDPGRCRARRPERVDSIQTGPLTGTTENVAEIGCRTKGHLPAA